MLQYLFKRLWHTVYVIIGVSVISFFFIHLSGDPVMLMLPGDASHQEIEDLREQLGFNDPIYVQYLRFAWQAETPPEARSTSTQTWCSRSKYTQPHCRNDPRH